MEKSQDKGRYLWRGGKKINLEKENEYFTVILRNKSVLDRVKTLFGVKSVDHYIEHFIL